MAEKELESDLKEEIWSIRELNDELERIKNKIMEFYTHQQNLNESTKKFWISDIKECYYCIIVAWELLWGSKKGEINNFQSSKQYLYNARSSFMQCKSELRSFNINEANGLASNLTTSFELCFNAMRNVLEKLIPQKIVKNYIKKIIEVSEVEYQLPCSVCGEIAVTFKIGKAVFDKDESLIYMGITHQSSLKKELSNRLFPLLKEEQLSLIHSFLKEYHTYEGLDAYCPSCDKIYCWDHYNPIQEFDDGFYDCTYGTCPEGHKRMIDD
jgi:hypothetical protein